MVLGLTAPILMNTAACRVFVLGTPFTTPAFLIPLAESAIKEEVAGRRLQRWTISFVPAA